MVDQEQADELARVRSRLGELVVAFWRHCMDEGPATFTADELREYIATRLPTAPASADRILRDLRQKGRINYRVVNRRASQYEALAPAPAEPAPPKRQQSLLEA